ncbi:MAG: alpha-amylase family glycosyl hydrolase [Pseudomonadota bacterium]
MLLATDNVQITQIQAAQTGKPYPLGCSFLAKQFNFALIAPNTTSLQLEIFSLGNATPSCIIEFDRKANRTGQVWHLAMELPYSSFAYRYILEADDVKTPCLDPYAPTLDFVTESNKRDYRSAFVQAPFDWEQVNSPRRPINELVIYEVHVGGLTKSPSSNVESPGTFAGLVEKIPYLKALGINAVELLPIFAFDETNNRFCNPHNKQRLVDYWGYNPLSFFAPHSTYASVLHPADVINELKSLVKALHAADIEVILDVVYNHTGEGDKDGKSYSFKKLADDIYYHHDEGTNEYANYSGCGNTVNCNHPIVCQLILDSLRYWVSEFHIDGFRFDLASILTRGTDGEPQTQPLLISQIEEDPVLKETKLIAECWDAAGLYQLSDFPGSARWTPWNGRFRDDLRGFLRGEPNLVTAMTQRICGSSDIFSPTSRSGINFITCHDGFTLRDLMSFNEKHNNANGENNRDGESHNRSWNCGIEGETTNPEIISLRLKQVRNALALTLLAAGTPMITAGDERFRSQQGNNNAYCQDSPITWIDWQDDQLGESIGAFTRTLIAIRRSFVLFIITDWVRHPKVSILQHGVELFKPDTSIDSRSVALEITYSDNGDDEQIYLVANAFWESLDFQLPDARFGAWHCLVNTADLGATKTAEQRISVAPRSMQFWASRTNN